MSIKAIFPEGVTALTVHGLHQWDYGRKLEITHPDLPAMLEVHFAAAGSREAFVRPVAGVNGVAEVSVPDALLEQSKPILAWVYVVGEDSGETLLTVTLPVQERARPAIPAPMPEEMGDKYTEALAAVNTQVASLKEGNVTVANALEANHAATADNAAEADKATQDGDGNNIKETYKTKTRAPFEDVASFAAEAGETYQFRVSVLAGEEPLLTTSVYSTIITMPGADEDAVVEGLVGVVAIDGTDYTLTIFVNQNNVMLLARGYADPSNLLDCTNRDGIGIKFRKI